MLYGFKFIDFNKIDKTRLLILGHILSNIIRLIKGSSFVDNTFTTSIIKDIKLPENDIIVGIMDKNSIGKLILKLLNKKLSNLIDKRKFQN